MSPATGSLLEAIASAIAFTLVAWVLWGPIGLVLAGTFAFAIAPALAAGAHWLLAQHAYQETDDDRA